MKKNLFQFRLDKWSVVHFGGAFFLMFCFTQFLSMAVRVSFGSLPVSSVRSFAETVSYLFVAALGVTYELGEHTADGSKESFDLADFALNLAGAGFALLFV